MCIECLYLLATYSQTWIKKKQVSGLLVNGHGRNKMLFLNLKSRIVLQNDSGSDRGDFAGAK